MSQMREKTNHLGKIHMILGRFRLFYYFYGGEELKEEPNGI